MQLDGVAIRVVCAAVAQPCDRSRRESQALRRVRVARLPAGLLPARSSLRETPISAAVPDIPSAGSTGFPSPRTSNAATTCLIKAPASLRALCAAAHEVLLQIVAHQCGAVLDQLAVRVGERSRSVAVNVEFADRRCPSRKPARRSQTWSRWSTPDSADQH